MEIQITGNESGQRLDRFLRKYLKDFSLANIYKVIRKKYVTVDHNKVSASYLLHTGETVQINLKRLDNREPSFEKKEQFSAKPLEVVYEDSNVLIINKEIGLLSHPEKPGAGDTLIGRVWFYLDRQGDYKPGSSPTFTPSLCNRLDRNTGGIVMAAKNYDTLRKLNALMRSRHIGKFYLTIVKGEIPGRGEICNFIKKEQQTNISRILAEADPGVKPVRTNYKRLRNAAGYSLLEVELITGRSHQIRTQFAHLGHPLVGDQKYGDPVTNNFFRNKFQLNHQFLFAHEIEFREAEGIDYLKGKRFSCGLPPYMEKIIKVLFY
jgi:23S rRNA pseudouridine955/2504/2580 synthase